MKCVICGRESNSPICARCYVERNRIVEVEKVEVEVCPRCSFYRVEGRWRDLSFEDAVEKALYKALLVHPEFDVKEAELSVSEKRRIGTVRLRGKFRGCEVEQVAEFGIEVKKTLCERCSREAGGYYESIVQLRAERRELSREEVEEVSRIVEEVLKSERENLKAFLTKVVERKEGIDYYIGGRDIGRKISKAIADRFGGTVKESRKIAGRKDGRDIYRFTYSVRLPEYRKGDVVMDETGLVFVTNPKLGKGVSIPEMSRTNLRRARVVVRREEMEEGVVVSTDERAAEVIKFGSGELVIAEKVGGDVREGEEVLLFEHSGKYYALPKGVGER